MRSVDLLHELQLADVGLAAERRRLVELRALLADRAELEAATAEIDRLYARWQELEALRGRG
jgi:hypothetical protein